MWELSLVGNTTSSGNMDGAGAVWLFAWAVLWILTVVACWRVFAKAGKPGWTALIPIVNIFVLLRIVRRPAWWLLLYIVPIVNVVVHLVVSIDTAKAFRKNAIFGVLCLWLLPPIGYLVLGFGGATYKGAPKKHKPISDPMYRQSLVFLLALLVAVGLSLAGWAGLEYLSDRQVKTAQETVNSKFKDVHLESETFQDEFFYGHVTYVVSENKTINQDIRGLVDTYFQPCKTAGEAAKSGLTHECLASPEVNFATDAYLEVTYTFRSYPGKSASKEADVTQVARLYDRKSGKQLGIADIFKPGANFAAELSELSRDALHNRFDGAYYNKGIAKDVMTQATQPDAKNFEDFLLTSDEKLTLVFEPGKVAPADEGPVQIAVDTNKLYDLFSESTVDVFLPKLKEQKEAEARLAKQATENRKRARELVAENRDNIDCTKLKCIAITYDDGPYAPYGDKLLDILKERNAVTTFFMVGNRVAPYAPELKRVVTEHSEIGNHSWDHSDLTKLSDADVASQVQRTNQAIYNASGVYPKLMRPPYGSVDARVKAQINMPLAYWSVDTLDWKFRNADTVYQNAIAGAKPGAIILMHEIHETTIDAAPRIIDELQRQGYVLVTVSELFGINKDNLQDFVNKKLFHN